MFGDVPKHDLPLLAAAGLDLEPSLDLEVSPPLVLEGQLDLFGDRWLGASAVHAALEVFDLNAARQALAELMRSYPLDEVLCERAQVVAALSRSLASAAQRTRSPARALLALAEEVPNFLAPFWHRRVASLLEQERGLVVADDCGLIGEHWLLAGEATAAERALRAALSLGPDDSRIRAYLGDALAAQGRTAEARIAYRDAFAGAPMEVETARIIDPVVRDLTRIAANEYELPGTPVTWTATLGLLEHVFLPPPSVPADWLEPSVLARLAPGLRFYRFLLAEMHATEPSTRIAYRRELKACSPELLRMWLEQRV